MTRRAILQVATLAMAIALCIGVAVAFFGSLKPNARARAALTFELGRLEPGQVKSFPGFSVYRRTPDDFASYVALSGLYADPDMVRSIQPLEARNEVRSVNRDYFVFLPFAPRRRCEIRLITAPDPNPYHPDKKAVNAWPHFQEPCEGRVFDTAGRLLARNGYPPEDNLIVPDVRWIRDDVVQLTPR